MRHAPLLQASVLVAALTFATGCDSAAADAGREIQRTDTAVGDTAATALVARADLGRIAGDSAAPVWLIVISDFQCPYCKLWHETTAPRIEREYVGTGKVRIAYLNFPIPSHRNSQPAHEAAMCAAEQGRFREAADAIFATQKLWKDRSDARAYFDSLATGFVIDRPRYDSCVNSGITRPLIQADYQRSVRRGVGSTPTFLVGSYVLVGAQPFDAFKQALDSALAKHRP